MAHLIKFCYYLCKFIQNILRHNRNLILLFLIVLFLQLIFFAFQTFTSIFKNEVITDDDSDVRTSNYLMEYLKLQNKWQLLKRAHDYENSDKKIIQVKAKNVRKIEYVILEYTKVMGQKKFCQHYDDKESANPEEVLYLKECPFTNCKFTCDKKKLNSANGVLFHESDLRKEVLNNPNYYEKLRHGSTNRANQIYILYNDEANPVAGSLDEFKFNWTMSYRIDSEVSDCSYGCTYLRDKEPNEEIAFQIANLFKERVKNDFKTRENKALWYVSNCDSSYRIDFASRLKEYFPIKVAGRCAKFVYSRNENFFVNFMLNLFQFGCDRNSICEYNEFQAHKFYLSFESKNCSNYITEKLWRILRTNMIPVVVQPNKQFYELYAPPNSFIHAQDFDYDPEKLGAYLRLVSSNFEIYFSHLKWKLDYEIVYSSSQVEKRRLCQLCTKFNTENSIIYYESVSDWFNKECIFN